MKYQTVANEYSFTHTTAPVLFTASLLTMKNWTKPHWTESSHIEVKIKKSGQVRAYRAGTSIHPERNTLVFTEGEKVK